MLCAIMMGWDLFCGSQGFILVEIAGGYKGTARPRTLTLCLNHIS